MTDNKRSINKIGGIKEDIGKIRPGLIPPQIIEELAKVLTYGADKYNADNWKKVEIEKYIDAFYRHWLTYLKSIEEGKRDVYDMETGYHHLSHALANLSFILYLDLMKDKNKE